MQVNSFNNNQSPVLYIDAPNFSHASNGIRCIYFLAKDLVRRQINIAFVPRSIRGFYKNLPEVFHNVEVAPVWALHPGSYLLCTESVPAETIKAARRANLKIIWWYLAPQGLLERPRAKPSLAEKILVFSPYILPSLISRYYFYQPPIDAAWEVAVNRHRPASGHKRPVIAIYCGKGILKYLHAAIRLRVYNSDIKIVTRHHPSSRKDLFAILAEADGLITFDELSQLSLEAATMGVPVYLANPIFPETAMSRFPIDLISIITSSPEVFIKLLEARRANLLRSVTLKRATINSASTVQAIIDLLKDNALEVVPPKNTLLADLNSFAAEIKKKKVLRPLYGGQAPSASLIRVYAWSLKESFFVHMTVCILMRLYDNIGSILFALGGSFLFLSATEKLRTISLMKMRRSMPSK